MNRRGFLGSILAACAAPAIVRADALMKIVPRELGVIAPAAGGYMAPDVVWAQLLDGSGNVVVSINAGGGVRDIVWPTVTGSEIEIISIHDKRGLKIYSSRDAVGLPLTPNGGDVIFRLNP